MNIRHATGNPFLLFCAMVCMISSIVLFTRFRVVVSWLDVACFVAVLVVFLLILSRLFAHLDARGSIRGQAILAFAIVLFVVWNFYLIALGLDGDA